MSKFVRVATELRDVALVKQALDDLAISYREHARYDHRWTGVQREVPILVEARGAHFGLCRPTGVETSDAPLEIVGDDMQMRAITRVMEQVQQRYAYHKVVAETALAGFSLVEERVGDDKVIRLTVRRWN